MTGIHFAVCCLALLVGSYFGVGKSDAELEDVVWSPAEYHAETVALKALPWYKNYRVHGLILIILVALILLAY